MNLLRAFARPLLATPFIADGMSALLTPDTHVDKATAVLPLAHRLAPDINIDDTDLRLITRVLGAASLTAGLSFATGRAPWTSAALLATLALPMAFINAPIWTGTTRDERLALGYELSRRLALAAGLAIAATDRVGAPSLSWTLSNQKKQHERYAATRNITPRAFFPRTDRAR